MELPTPALFRREGLKLKMHAGSFLVVPTSTVMRWALVP